MSELCRIRHLRTTSQEDAIRLLEAANMPGFVYPPQNGWGSFLSEDEPCDEGDRFARHNVCLLLDLYYCEGDRWGYMLWRGSKLVTQYAFFAAIARKWAAQDAPRETAIIASELGLDGATARALSQLLSGENDAHRQSAASAHLFAELLGIAPCRWASYWGQVLHEPEDRLARDGICAVKPRRLPSPAPQLAGLGPAEGSGDWLLLPKCLFGDARSTRREWAKRTRRAWNEGTWSGVLEDIDLIPISDLPAPIIVSADPDYPPLVASMWRPYWIGELLQDVAGRDSRMDLVARAERVDMLLQEGLGHFWFALGLLQTGGGGFWLECWPRSRSHEELGWEYLSLFVRWLPEFRRARKYVVRRLSGLHWLLHMARLGMFGGLDHPFDVVQRRYDDDIATAFLELGVVRRVGDRLTVASARPV